MPYQNINLVTLRTLVFNRIQNQQFFSTAEINDALNEGLKLYNLGTGRFKKRYAFTTVAKRCIYDLTLVTQLQDGNGCAEVLMPIRLLFNSATLDPVSVFDMDNGYPGWQFQTTATAGVPSTPQFWGPMGLNLIFIWPADNAGANGLQMDAIRKTPILVNDGDFINMDSSEIVALIGYAAHVLPFKRGGSAFQSTMPLYREFLRMVVGRNSYLASAAPFRNVIGEDSSRRQRPRRVEDRRPQPYALGLR